jgi:hypothetical protein
MRSSPKRLALTSVAYAVTLLVVSSAAAVQLTNMETAKAEAQATPIQLNSTAETNRMLAQRSVPVALKTAPRPKPVVSREDYFANKRDPLTGKELAELLTLVGFEGKSHKIAWALVMRESNARPKAHNGNSGTGDNSYGIFQINMIGSLGADRRDKFDLSSNDELFNPLRNAEIAYHMSGRGSDFGAWGIGPNAYRQGAGESTIMKWYDDYPGIGK